MIGIVRAYAFGFCQRQDAGEGLRRGGYVPLAKADGASARAQYPAGNQVDKNMSRRLGKDGRKTQDYGVPCRPGLDVKYITARHGNSSSIQVH